MGGPASYVSESEARASSRTPGNTQYRTVGSLYKNNFSTRIKVLHKKLRSQEKLYSKKSKKESFLILPGGRLIGWPGHEKALYIYRERQTM